MTIEPDEADPNWIDWFAEQMVQASPEEEAFWERRRRLGLGVGLDENGNIAYGKDTPPRRWLCWTELRPKRVELVGLALNKIAAPVKGRQTQL